MSALARTLRGRPVALLAGAIFFLGVASRATAEPLPFALSVQVSFAESSPSPTLRDEIERRILDVVGSRACFASARAVPPDETDRPPGDLLLDLVLGEVRDETRYDQTLAGAMNPDDPDAQIQYSVVLSIQVSERIVALPGGVQLRAQRFRPQVERRPMYIGDDARSFAKEELLSILAKRAASIACDVSKKKAKQAVDAARSVGGAVQNP